MAGEEDDDDDESLIEGFAGTGDKGAAVEDQDEGADVDEEDGGQRDEAAAAEPDLPVHERLGKGA